MGPCQSRWLLVLLLFVPGCAATVGGGGGTIRGRLEMPSSSKSAAPAHAHGGSAPARETATDAVIYVENVPTPEPGRSPATTPATIGQLDHRFLPRVLPVAAGTTVAFENRDQVYHNVFSVSPVKRFDVGKYAPRQKREVKFEKPGIVKLYCDIDPSMTGFVFVLPTAVFAQPDASGAFELPRLPRGKYTLKVWHPSLGRATRDVEIPKKGDLDVTLNF